ncbi:MAG: sigma-70 family RNA polymerase sigma factor [Clostridia bacterium]|nr:sigma-70 family RNA polymerase sigma factor [Clostridia bacterium]
MLLYLQTLETSDDKAKFEALYRTYCGLMVAVAMKLLSNRADAEDAVHQAFLSILKNMDKISDVDCLKTKSYVVIITENKAIDLLRARKKTLPRDFEEEPPGVTIPPPGEDDLAAALARLPARYREILLLHYHHGYSRRELSQMLELSYAAVQQLIWRAKAALRKQLEGGDGT